jgi:murein DD-endopeptidase MepM/ murein hydrolase activator NlpD
MHRSSTLFIGFILTGLCFIPVGWRIATAVELDELSQAEVANDINHLNGKISEKRSSIDQINKKIESYQAKIDAAQAKEVSLQNEVDLLQNRIAKTELDIQSTTQQADVVNDEISLLDVRINALQDQLKRDKEALSSILRKVDVFDNDLSLQLLFGTDSFAELFARMQELNSVSGDLQSALDRAEEAKRHVEASRVEQLAKRERLEQLSRTLSRSKDLLEDERSAKESVLAEAAQSEATFRSFVYELKEEQTYVNQQIASLQGEIESKLTTIDSGSEGGSILSWPVDPSYRGISALYHDPTYPFRHLFEHSGLDVPEPTGTPVVSAAPGYVAFTRTGRLYGNYVMIIHSNGIATLYAHLSKILVSQDQFVGRGETIALSGGAKGAPGAGLSTGPHLHFEVRSDGIPVDPLGYLVAQ